MCLNGSVTLNGKTFRMHENWIAFDICMCQKHILATWAPLTFHYTLFSCPTNVKRRNILLKIFFKFIKKNLYENIRLLKMRTLYVNLTFRGKYLHFDKLSICRWQPCTKVTYVKQADDSQAHTYYAHKWVA